MRWHGICGGAAAACIAAALGSDSAISAPGIDLQRDGRVAIAGRSLKCGGARNILDSRLPNLGVAARGVVVFNPRLLNRHSDTVRLFVFHHECGHHHVGASETGADCWAVKRGIRDGWLNGQNLAEVCQSFGNGPQTPTHPSGASRCASLRACFVGAIASQRNQPKKSVMKAAGAGPSEAGTGRRLSSQRVRAGYRR